MNAERVVFHTASVGKAERSQAVEITKNNLKKLIDAIEEKQLKNFILCPETMGKIGQIGTVDEIIDFCNLADYFYHVRGFWTHKRQRTRLFQIRKRIRSSNIQIT